MSRLRGFLKQLRVFVRRDAVERDLAEELDFHVAMETEKNVRAGMAPVDARRAALLAFNGVERTREEVRAARWTHVLEEAAADVRHALRSLRRRPGFAALAILTLALGIGSNSALFGLLEAVAFRLPPGVAASDRLVRVDNAGNLAELSYPDYRDLRDAAEGAVDLAAYETAGMGIAIGGDAFRVTGHLVSGNFFDVLGLVPAHGRGIQPPDDVPGAPAVVVLGHALWRDRLGADAAVIGRTLHVNGHAFTVIGVAPAGFTGLDIEAPADLLVPIATQPIALPRTWPVLEARNVPSFAVIGRLRSGVPVSRAATLVGVAAAGLEAAATERLRPLQPQVVRLRGMVRLDRMGGILPIAGVAALFTGLVLLVTCANVANLQFARGFARRREIGVRIAIGAGRGRVVRLLLAEVLILAVGAAVAGTAVAFWGASVFEARFRGALTPLDVSPDATTLVFTLMLAVAAALLSGLVPALRASTPEVTRLLGRGETMGPRRMQRGLVIAQVAGSLVLLVCAALLVRRVQHAEALDPGFDASRVLAASVDLTAHGYEGDAVDAFHRTLRDALRDAPGVAAVSLPGFAPFGEGAALMGITREEAGRGAAAAPPSTRVAAVGLGVGDGWFETLGIVPNRGRVIDARDLAAGAQVAVVDEALAERLWPGEDPLGRLLRADGLDRTFEVIGIVPPVTLTDPHARMPQVLLPWTQHYQFAVSSLLVRASGDPRSLVPAVRAAVSRIDATLPVFDSRTLEDRFEERLAISRVVARIVGGFGVLALVLAALGLYGVVVFTVAGRTREIGIRVALGARPRTVVAEIVRDGLGLVALGLISGAVCAIGVGRVMASVVDGMPGVDPAAAFAAAALLLTVAVIASWIPARRAARVDPLQALRVD